MRRVANIALLAVVIAVGVLIGRAVLGKDDPYVVNIQLADAGGILKHYNVKIGQVAAGEVKDIDLDKHDNVWLKVELDKGAYPIGKGASAKVRPVNLLGEKYLDLDPGDLKQPLPSGSAIRKDKTGVPVELDDVLNTLDPDTRAAMRIVINEAGTATMGRGTDFNKTLENLPPALDKAKQVVGEVASENRRLKSAIVSGDSVLSDITAKRDDLGELIESGNGALTTLAERRDDLGRTIQTAPGGVTQLRRTLQQLQGASDQLTPAATDLRQASPSLAQTLERLPAFSRDAQSTLTAVRQVSPTLEKLGRRSRPTLRRLRPTANRLSTFAKSFGPLVNSLDKQDGLRAFLGFMDGWAGVTADKDGLGNSFRLRLVLDSSILQSLANRYVGAGQSAFTSKSRNAAASDKQAQAKANQPSATPKSAPQSQPPAPAPQSTSGAPSAQDKKTDLNRLSDYLLGQ